MTIRSIYPESTKEPHDSYTVVIDGKDFIPGKSETDELTAREQIEILQKLVKIQKSEDWEMWVLFNGEPLHQVDHGGDFLGIRVFFSPTSPQRVPTLLECVKVLKKTNQHTLMVTNDTQLESRAKALGASTLRSNTLKKGFESLFVSKSRPQSRLMRHRSVDKRKSQLWDNDNDDPDIRDLIDLVDD